MSGTEERSVLFNVALNLTPGICGEKLQRDNFQEKQTLVKGHRVLGISQMEGIRGWGKVP